MSLIILEISPSYLNERMGEALTLHPLSPMNNRIQKQGEGLLFSAKNKYGKLFHCIACPICTCSNLLFIITPFQILLIISEECAIPCKRTCVVLKIRQTIQFGTFIRTGAGTACRFQRKADT